VRVPRRRSRPAWLNRTRYIKKRANSRGVLDRRGATAATDWRAGKDRLGPVRKKIKEARLPDLSFAGLKEAILIT
jgi:hypothetical protein